MKAGLQGEAATDKKIEDRCRIEWTFDVLWKKRELI